MLNDIFQLSKRFKNDLEYELHEKMNGLLDVKIIVKFGSVVIKREKEI